jgi:type I restriction enzyme S subunit
VARVQSGFAFKSAWFGASGVRLLRGSNVAPRRTRWDDTVYLDMERAREYSQYRLSAGDIVLAMDRPLIAEGLKVCRIAAEDLPCLLVQRVARLVAGAEVLPDYLYMALQEREFCRHLERRATGTQLPHVSASAIASAPLPVPPLAEQRVIVAATLARLGGLERASRLHVLLREALAGVEQAVLGQAFRGSLVTQAAEDEPASALLARLARR